MRQVKLLARLPGGVPSDVYDRLIAFERYADLVEPVRFIEVRHVSPTQIDTTWSVLFRKGILNWSERDYLDRDGLTIRFEQDEGDFDVLTGSYRVEPTADGCDIHFESTFDFGVASIESIVEPIAARVLKENFELVLIGLLGEDIFFPPDDEQPVPQVHTRHDVLDHGDAARLPGLVAAGENGAR